jgi:hypothetical protein
MTNVRDMIKQVEIVFYDHEYPPTKKELEGMLKILKTIYIHNKLNRAMHHTPTAIASKKVEFSATQSRVIYAPH